MEAGASSQGPEKPEGSVMTLVSEVIELPEVVHPGDFVLKLAEGIDHADQTVAQYVVTQELAARFEEALAMIRSAIDSGSSKAAYLDGSFGAGKSHFMAVLAALLDNNPRARAIPELARAVEKYDGTVLSKRYLHVPYHLVGYQSLEEAVLGGYVAEVARRHPDAPPPAVLLDAPLLETARSLRTKLGDQAFFGMLGGSGESGWGDLAAGWDAPRFEAALSAPRGDAERDMLVAALQSALPGYAELARGAGTGYVGIDDGLAAISQHAASLGYDALVLFLDELILWFASRMGDQAWVSREAPKVAKLVEAANPNRPVPIVSFVARQRDLRELVGTTLPGADHLAFADELKWWEDRFGRVKLSDANLPVIAARRVLRPRNETAKTQIDASFSALDSVRQDIRAALMTASADREAFRLTYPFSPAFVETLVALSSELQRDRTALRIMQQLLVDQRDTLELGLLVPLSDLYDALIRDEQPMTGELAKLWRNAQKVYTDILRLILEMNGVTEEQLPLLPPTHAAHRDQRIAKTMVLAALMPEVESVRELTARKIIALNHGYIRSLVPGQEVADVLGVVRRWAARYGAIQLTGEDASPVISARLEGVDIEVVLDNARAADTLGARRQQIRALLCEALGTPDEVPLGGVTAMSTAWRGTQRTVELVFGNIRDRNDLADAMFRPSHESWRAVLGYPIDEPGHDAAEDLGRAADLAGRQPAHTVCWVPRRLAAQAVIDLGRYVKLRYALGPSFDQLAGHLPANERMIAKQQMTTLAEQLKSQLSNALLQAYGMASPDGAVVDTGHGGRDMFASLEPGFEPRVPAGAGMRQGLENLADQMLEWDFPAHPRFPGEVTRADLRKVHAQVRRAIEAPEHRIMVEASERAVMRKVANPLRLGEQHEQYFVLGHDWESHFNRKIAEAGAGVPVTIGELRAWLDQPRPMGLPQQIADLVVLVFAEQTNRAVVVGEERIDVSQLRELPADARVVEQPLPGEEEWETARLRGQSIFGIGDVAEPRTARNVGLLAAKVRAAATARLEPARALRELLAAKGLQVLGPDADPGATDRARIADSAVQLCEELAASPSEVVLTEALARYRLPTGAPEHLARSLATAADVVKAGSQADWNIIVTVSGWQHGHPLADRARDLSIRLRSAWAANEVATGLRPAIETADQAARKLLVQAQAPTGEHAPSAGGPVPATAVTADARQAAGAGIAVFAERGEREVDATTLGDLTAGLGQLARDGKRVRVSWQVIR
jgi:Family of unknown function (DUF6079)